MADNPYSPAGSIDTVKKSILWLPATILVALIVMTLLVDAWYLLMLFLDLQNAAQQIGWSFSMVRNWAYPISLALLIAIHCFLLFAMVCVLRRRRRDLGVLGCIVAMVPVLTPGLLLGIPFAAWTLALLMRPDVRTEFDSG